MIGLGSDKNWKIFFATFEQWTSKITCVHFCPHVLSCEFLLATLSSHDKLAQTIQCWWLAILSSHDKLSLTIQSWWWWGWSWQWCLLLKMVTMAIWWGCWWVDFHVYSDVGGVTGHNGDEIENLDSRFYQLITSRMVFLVALVITEGKWWLPHPFSHVPTHAFLSHIWPMR